MKYVLWGVVAYVLAANFLWPSARDAAFRSLSPDSSACREWRDQTVLSRHHNDELEFLANVSPDVGWAMRLQCSVQTHSVRTGDNELRYHLSFLEFQENADPFFLTSSPGSAPTEKSQFDAIETHLREVSARGKHNYVIAFIHGWRHDASIGDTNVADARLYGISAARHLAIRCGAAGGDRAACDTEVTVVYVGWRGQRVNENGMARLLRPWESTESGSPGWLLKKVRESAGTVAAIPTLFDRKPVSEQIGPSVVTALRYLSTIVHKSDPEVGRHLNRLVVFGHSLGGNLLASSLRDYIVRAVSRRSGDVATPVKSPVGDLTVLINPASEAGNWAAIQRAVLQKIAFRADDATETSSTMQGHRFFPDNQPPVLISITSARSWPPGGFRSGDCAWLNRSRTMNDDGRRTAQAIEPQKQTNRTLLKENVDYDWSTYDLFPAFKGDFRPLASTVDRFFFRIEGVTPRGLGCDAGNEEPLLGAFGSFVGWLGHRAANVLRVVPFMNTDVEKTRTIGHLDPTRPPFRVLTDFSILPFSQIGTTHQLTTAGIVQDDAKYDELNAYVAIATETGGRYDCDPAVGWLAKAKTARKDAERTRIQPGDTPFATFWDTRDLAVAAPKLRFVHGFEYGGSAAITRANDPFWNVRAFGDVVSQHNGYVFPEFICAMSQVVMDDIANYPAQ